MVKMNCRKGQGMTEYIIIVAMIAIAAIIVVKLFGSQIREVFTKSSESLGTGQVQEVEQQEEGQELPEYYK